jgi:hypothetical protein
MSEQEIINAIQVLTSTLSTLYVMNKETEANMILQKILELTQLL